MGKKVVVDANALRMVIQALVGPGHYIRELQATRGLPGDDRNPIDQLVEEYNAQLAAFDLQKDALHQEIETQYAKDTKEMGFMDIIGEMAPKLICAGVCLDRMVALAREREPGLKLYEAADKEPS
jgi:hypothetical protein